jgi:hypothetical protein
MASSDSANWFSIRPESVGSEWIQKFEAFNYCGVAVHVQSDGDVSGFSVPPRRNFLGLRSAGDDQEQSQSLHNHIQLLGYDRLHF